MTAEVACRQRLLLIPVRALPAVLRDIEDHAVGVLELALEVAVSLVAEVEEELTAGCLDLFLRLREVLDLDAEVMRADEGLAFLDIGGGLAAFAFEIEQRHVDDAVAHVDRRADVEIFAADLLDLENLGVELGRLVEVFDADGDVAQTGHGMLS